MKRNRRPPDSADNAPKKTLKPGKARLDVLLVERGMAPSRERAQALLLAGNVRVNGAPAGKAGALVPRDSRIETVGELPRYASRGGLKLEGALEDFNVTPQNRICLDVGSSTGGFTDCLLQHGATKVYAVDVTTSQLDWKLQRDPSVVPVRCNARFLRRSDIGESAGLITMDVSFISVTKLLPAIVPFGAPNAEFLILIKPQFELGKGEVGKGGIVRNPALHAKAIESVSTAAANAGLAVSGVRSSRITGTEGNQEFFLHARLAVLE